MDTDAKTYIYRSLDNVTEMQDKEKDMKYLLTCLA